MSIEEEAAEVARVKRPEEVVVRDVHTTSPNRTIREASLQMARSEVSSLLVVDRRDATRAAAGAAAGAGATLAVLGSLALARARRRR